MRYAEFFSDRKFILAHLPKLIGKELVEQIFASRSQDFYVENFHLVDEFIFSTLIFSGSTSTIIDLKKTEPINMTCITYCRQMVFTLFTIFSAVYSAQAEVTVGRFDSASLVVPAPWQVIRLEKNVPPTLYRVTRWDGIDSVEANAKSSMALLGRQVAVDIAETPILCWRWRVDHVVKTADMTRRHGDDYAARIYLAFELPPESLSFGDRAALAVVRSIFGKQVPDAAINYVWDNRHPVGSRLPNAYTDRAQMIVRRSGNADAAKWVTERVNVKDDVASAFGTNKVRILLLAIAADSYNTGETVRSGFADIHFVRTEDACTFANPENTPAREHRSPSEIN